MELVAIKVKIGLKDNGHAKYPQFNSLDASVRDNMDWCHFVDKFGGWHYDQTSGHREDTADSPLGQQWGMLLVPASFADAAITAFPSEVSKMTEAEAESFYNAKAHINDPDELFDQDVLSGIKMKQELSLPLTANQQKALDPNDDTPGIRKNKDKTWSAFKDRKKITLKAVAIEP